jgi:rhamnosyltransferase subunit B
VRKFIVVALGTTGDVHPFLGIAAALQERGHAVTFLANERFEEIASRVGVAFHPAGWVVAHPLAVIGGAGLARERLPDTCLVAAYLAPANLRSCHEPSRMGPVRVPNFFPPQVVRWLWKRIDALFVHPVVLPELNALREELGLAPVRSFAEYVYGMPDLAITLFPDWFAKLQPDWPRRLERGDFLLFDSLGGTGLPKALEEFLNDGEPPVVFTPGSGMRHGAEFFRASLSACLRLGKRGVFLTAHVAQIPDALPPTIKWFEYIPFRPLLQRAAALVHHGGIGSCAEAMRAGIPQLVMPMAHDQFDNAARLEALGVGLRIARRRYSAHTVVEKLSALLRSEAIREQCRKIAARFHDMRPADSVCQLIEHASRSASPSFPRTAVRSR